MKVLVLTADQDIGHIEEYFKEEASIKRRLIFWIMVVVIALMLFPAFIFYLNHFVKAATPIHEESISVTARVPGFKAVDNNGGYQVPTVNPQPAGKNEASQL